MLLKYIFLAFLLGTYSLAYSTDIVEEGKTKTFINKTEDIRISDSSDLFDVDEYLKDRANIYLSREFTEQERSQFQRLFFHAQKSEEFSNLLADIKNRYPSLEIKFSDDIPVKAATLTYRNPSSNYECYIHYGEILIRREIMHDFSRFYDAMIWELCNAGNQYLSVAQTISNDEHEYAFFTEAAEYMTKVHSTNILIDYLTQNKNDPDFIQIIYDSLELSLWERGAFYFAKFLFGNTFNLIDFLLSGLNKEDSSFKKHWDSVNETSPTSASHADLYRKVYLEKYAGEQKWKYKEVTEELKKELIEIAFSEWEENEEIPYISERTRNIHARG